jgi:hypothetical protein
MERIKNWVKKYFSGWRYRRQLSAGEKAATESWLQQLSQQPPSRLSGASYDVFTYHGEDGILLYLLQQLKDVPATFVDIGAGDCIKSNCANLAVHYSWAGVFIDQNDRQLAIGRNFYKKKIATGANLQFINAVVTVDTVDHLIGQAGIGGEIGLLSIDIDGNDYWIWKAIERVQPRIVVIEAKVEFGSRDVVVPYGRHNHHSADKLYNGASVTALQKLGAQKGYKLAGSNKQGYNLFFVKQQEVFPTAGIEDILDNPETKQSFYPPAFFDEHVFETSQ